MTNKLTATKAIKDLQTIAKQEKKIILQRFFKTGPGQYGEGDVFLGITVPQQRFLAKQYSNLALVEIEKLLKNKYHEVRLTGLLILVLQFQKTKNEKDKKVIYDFYISHLSSVNNWDLVDVTTPNIVGEYLLNKPKKILYQLAQSKNLWERRVSMLACFTFIKNRSFDEAIKIAKLHLGDNHDLMHKAVGWMLREIGKRDVLILKSFLKDNISKMSRTTLRYAIEHFSEKERKFYLNM